MEATSAAPLFRIISICKGGGYRYCRTEPPHPKQNAKGLYPLHRVLVENKLGRLLLDDEEVHHDNEDKSDDSIDNLKVMSRAEHRRHHRLKVDDVRCECKCGKQFSVRPNIHRLRVKRAKGGQIYCSRSCGTVYATK
jgi:predicted Zn-ribbon and HTH transcriptional regulator